MLALLGDGSFVHQWSQVRIVDPGIHCQPRGGIHKAIDKGVIDRSGHKKTVGAKAILPGRREFCVDGFADRDVQIGVFEDDEWRVPTQFQDQPLNGVCRARIQHPTDLG